MPTMPYTILGIMNLDNLRISIYGKSNLNCNTMNCRKGFNENSRQTICLVKGKTQLKKTFSAKGGFAPYGETGFDYP